MVRDEAELVEVAKSVSASEFSGWCVSWRHSVDPDDPVSEQLGREDHGMTVNELDANSSELTLRASTGEIEQLRAAINKLADDAWRTRRDADGGGDPVDDATEAGNGPDSVDVAGDDDAGDADPARASTERVHPVRGRLQAEAAAELAARAHTTATGGGSGRGGPVVVVVMDWDTFNTEAQRFATGHAAPVDVFAPGYRSETLDGHPIPPAEGFWMALAGEVQRCVIGAESLKIDLGCQQRLFNTAGRRAVQVRDRTCVHPACDLPATWADIDHVLDWQHDGPTNVSNAQALCRYHHTQKHHRQPPGQAA